MRTFFQGVAARRGILVLAFAGLGALLAAGLTAQQARPGSPGGGDLPAAPSWTLPDVSGKPVSSSDFEGKVVVVDFWATWCPPCRVEIPGYVELQNKYKDQGLVILGISLDQGGPRLVQRFMEQFQINYPVVMGDRAITEAFGGIEAIPTTFIIDRQGRIAFSKVGAMHTPEFESHLLPFLQ